MSFQSICILYDFKSFFSQKYYLTLGKQVTKPNKEQHVGSHLSGEFVDYFNDDQAEQLLELHKAIKNPTEGNGGSPSQHRNSVWKYVCID